MDEVSVCNYTYQDVCEGLVFENDPYSIASLFSGPTQKAFLANPFLKDKNDICLYLRKVNNDYAGIAMAFPTQIKAGDEIIDATSGSTLEVYEKYRKLEIGSDLMTAPIYNEKNKVLLFAGLSDMALPLYKVLRYSIFEYPRAMQLRSIKPFFEGKGLKGFSLSLLSSIIDALFKPIVWISHFGSYLKKRKYHVERVSTIPAWVNEIVENDGHKYAEFHNQAWFQWNLDNNLHAEKGDIQSFYCVYKHDEPYGFFMTKERYRKEAGGALRNAKIGSIMEWGSKDENSLTEADLYTIALSTFGKIDVLEFASVSTKVLKQMRKYGFIHHGAAHIAFKDLTKKYKDAKDMSLWRIRFGYADVLLT